ncbi:S-phase kinase-associated protein 1-like [Aethina tumida]|uniref:S-phase kinase-associated protein 1-like n=1 Tax=Aethina tumida TaxID=116153 RepID=UPI002147DED2|nr:S-phase kinase-associated protein 1-like [Aethina tumida]
MKQNDVPTVKLMSKEGHIFDVDIDAVKCSTVIASHVDTNGVNEVVPLTKVSSLVLGLITEYITYHKFIPVLTENDDNGRTKSDNISDWDRQFMEIDDSTVFDMLLAAHYLELDDLENLCCKTIANIMQGLTPGEICQRFNIKNDFPPFEQEPKVTKDNLKSEF